METANNDQGIEGNSEINEALQQDMTPSKIDFDKLDTAIGQLEADAAKISDYFRS
ncbi:MAG: hypothetical protein M0Z45_10275 [Actinomycetota bacterium]|nr:hypothetical protein [Actinomycetota bacterium]